MEKELEKKLTKESELKMMFKEGKARIELAYDGSGANAGVFVELESEYFLDKLADAIPGEMDDFVIEALKKAMGI